MELMAHRYSKKALLVTSVNEATSCGMVDQPGIVRDIPFLYGK
jgi:hypothetical protein